MYNIAGKNQAFKHSITSNNTRSWYGQEFPVLGDSKPASTYNGGSNNLFGSASATSTSRFPTIGTFSLDSNNTYNSAGDSPPIFSNGNSSASSYNDSNSANQGTRETGIIEKLLVISFTILLLIRLTQLWFIFSTRTDLSSVVSGRRVYSFTSVSLPAT